MTTSTDPITITPVDYHDAAIGVLSTRRKMELSTEDCVAIVMASGLTAHVETVHRRLDDKISALARGHKQENDTAGLGDSARAKIGESDPQQVRADLRDAQAEVARLTEMRVADALAGNSRATARAEKAETELENVRAAWRNMDATVIARAEKAEAELVIAKAAIIGLQEGVREGTRQARAAEEGLSVARRRIVEIQAAYTKLLEERAVAKDAMKGVGPCTTTIKETT